MDTRGSNFPYHRAKRHGYLDLAKSFGIYSIHLYNPTLSKHISAAFSTTLWQKELLPVPILPSEMTSFTINLCLKEQKIKRCFDLSSFVLQTAFVKVLKWASSGIETSCYISMEC